MYDTLSPKPRDVSYNLSAIAALLAIFSVAPSHLVAQTSSGILGIDSYEGRIVPIVAPPSVSNGALVSPNDFNQADTHLFLERADYTVSAGLPVDLVAFPGTYDRAPQFVGGSLPRQRVNSYFFHLDTPADVGEDEDVYRSFGSVTFSEKIVGVVGFANTLLATNELQSPATAYPDRQDEDHDFDAAAGGRFADSLTLSCDLRTLTFEFLTGGSMDQLRVITERVAPRPQPQYTFQGLGSGWRASAVSDIFNGPLVVTGAWGFAPQQGLRWTQGIGLESIATTHTQDVSADGAVIVGGGGAGSVAYRWTTDGTELFDGGTSGLGLSRDGKLMVGAVAVATGVQAFIWDADHPGLGIQALPNLGSTSFNSAYEVERDSEGAIWVVGRTSAPSSGTPTVSIVVWRDVEPYASFPGKQNTPPRIAMVPASLGSSATVPLVLVDGGSKLSSFRYMGEDSNGIPIWDEQVLPLDSQISTSADSRDVSSGGQVVVGTAAGEAVVWNNTACGSDFNRGIWGDGTNRGQLVSEILIEHMPSRTVEQLNLTSWDLDAAVGVTASKKYVPSLATHVYASAVVGLDSTPFTQTTNWLATVYAAPDLAVDELTRENLLGGGFEAGGAGWTVVGDGTFDQVPSPSGDGLAGRLTTETEVSITQLIDTPSEPFVLTLDQLFASTAGAAEVSLGGVVLGERFAVGTVETDLNLLAYLVADPSLVGQEGVELKITALGGSTGQIIMDNISFATAVPSPEDLPGDINLDGVVNNSDIALFVQYFGTESGGTWTTGDFDNDGAVAMSDLMLLQAHFGQFSTVPQLAAIPEPSSILLISFGVVAASTAGHFRFNRDQGATR